MAKKISSQLHIRNMLEPTLRDNNILRGVKRAEVLVLWRKVAGAELARFTSAKRFRDGVLWVEVADSETAMHLNYQRQHFLAAYHDRFAVKNLRDIRFSVGIAPDTQTEVETIDILAMPLNAPEQQQLQQLSQTLGKLELTPELAQTTLATATHLIKNRAYKQKQDYIPCEACGVLTHPRRIKEGLCFICYRYLSEPKVLRASQQLQNEPDAALPILSEDERRVAALLAKRQLEQKLHELLPFVLADSNYRAIFTASAHCYLAHALDKELATISRDDYAFLPVNMARVVGYWS